MNRIVILFVLVMFVYACRPSEQSVLAPALLANPGPESLAEIEQTISTALGGGRVTLAEDVFTTSSVLVLERGLQHGIERMPELGRDLGRPYRFQLVTDGARCILVNSQEDGYWPLTRVECVPE